eukprot:scaffold7944_cov131-Isochrysis_galbana.AAC.12
MGRKRAVDDGGQHLAGDNADVVQSDELAAQSNRGELRDEEGHGAGRQAHRHPHDDAADDESLVGVCRSHGGRTHDKHNRGEDDGGPPAEAGVETAGTKRAGGSRENGGGDDNLELD